MTTPFHIMIKPVGSACNLACSYCFYGEGTSERLNRASNSGLLRLSDAMLETVIVEYLQSQQTDEVCFTWQGGEPTLAGIEFFRRALALQRRHASLGTRITNALQTNGTTLNGEWLTFLRDNAFLVGLSIDGPKSMHDQHRCAKSGAPTFDEVVRTLDHLQAYGIAFNTLTVVQRSNGLQGRRVYRFLKSRGVEYMQFIPLVERLDAEGNQLPPPPDRIDFGTARIAPWSVSPEGYGTFLNAVFDEWIKRDVGRIYVQNFDALLGKMAGYPAAVCVHAETCGRNLVLERDGAVYACDHYAYPDYYRGRIGETAIIEMVDQAEQIAFGLDKQSALPDVCTRCRFKPVCNGGCPKHRFAAGKHKPENYLCASYRRFFTHTDTLMHTMLAYLKQGKSPALVMQR